MTMHAAAIIPAFNEARSIAAVVEGVRGTVAHVIVVDDGSSDETAERARAAGAEVVVHTVNLGKGHAVRTGIARVLAGAFTHVLLLDADLQHLPAEAAALLAEAETSGAEVVLGQRRFDRSRNLNCQPISGPRGRMEKCQRRNFLLVSSRCSEVQPSRSRISARS